MAHEDLLDHLVGERKQRRRHPQAKRFGGFEIDHKIEFDRLFDWKISRLGALEYFVNVASSARITPPDLPRTKLRRRRSDIL
jgi:hypothetical protein